MATDDFFRARLERMIDMRHPLAVLATRMPWAQIEASLAPLFVHRSRAGRTVTDADLFGRAVELVGAGASNAGRPRLPCDDSQIGRFRQVLGEAGVEQLFKTTIEAAVDMGAIKRSEFDRVIVDATVQEKAIAHPSDSRLLEVARARIAQLATRAGVKLKQSYAAEGQQLRRRAGGYAHARQFKRLRRVLRRQRVILGRLLRDVQRKIGDGAHPGLQSWMERAWRIQRKRPHDSNKLYALHAPEVECAGKGKARRPFEFGVKVSMAVAHKSGLIVGARSFPGNPYDGHTLAGQIEQTTNLLQDIGVMPTTAVVDLGYRGVDHLVPVHIIHRGRCKTMTDPQRRWLKRRQAIEPTIGHTKQDHGMRRCWLKGSDGDALHAVLCAAGFNIRWLLRAIARGGIAALFLTLWALHLWGRHMSTTVHNVGARLNGLTAAWPLNATSGWK